MPMILKMTRLDPIHADKRPRRRLQVIRQGGRTVIYQVRRKIKTSQPPFDWVAPVIERVDGFKHEYHYNAGNQITREVVIRLNDDGTETSEKSITDYNAEGIGSWESYSDGAGKSGSWFVRSD